MNAKRRAARPGTTKRGKHDKSPTAEPAVAAAAAKPRPAYPVFEHSGSSAASHEPAAEPSAQEGAKRKRRRRKGKTGAARSTDANPHDEASAAPLADEPASEDTAPSQARKAKARKHDPAALAKLAWKIYLAEVSEEGVALIGDSDARELSGRCFRLAEIFMDEQLRRQ